MLRQMSLADLETVLDRAAAEGWNPGLEDAAAYWAADPEGFFPAEPDGQPVAKRIGELAHVPCFARSPEQGTRTRRSIPTGSRRGAG